MSREEMIGPDSPPAQTGPYVDVEAGSAASAPSTLAHIDALAVSALSTKALARYQAYKEVLLAREPDEAAVLSTLTLFVWDLSR
ncbi:MAG TPA: hypothetical protein VIU34_05760 [Steroidobacter sp.]